MCARCPWHGSLFSLEDGSAIEGRPLFPALLRNEGARRQNRSAPAPIRLTNNGQRPNRGWALAQQSFAWHKSNPRRMIPAPDVTMPTVPPPSRDATVDPVLFWFRYKTELLAGLLILILAAVGFIGYRLYVDHRDSSAAEALAAAHAIPEYQRVIDQYSGTPATLPPICCWRRSSARQKISAKPTPRFRHSSTNSRNTNSFRPHTCRWQRISSRWKK